MPLRWHADGFACLAWPEVGAEYTDRRAAFLRRVFEAAERIRLHTQDVRIEQWQCDLRVADSRVTIRRSLEGPERFRLLAELLVPDSEAVFACALRAGARSVVPSVLALRGACAGSLVDPFGNAWNVGRLVADSGADERCGADRGPTCVQSASAEAGAAWLLSPR